MRIGWVALAAGCGGWARGEAEGAFPCGVDVYDVWQVDAGSGGALRIVTDTVDEATAFDAYFLVYSVTSWGGEASEVGWGEELGSADDEFRCTFPPPDHGCPQLVLDVTEDVAVLVGSYGECVGADAAYRLEVELDGAPTRLRSLGQVTEDAVEGDLTLRPEGNTDSGD